MTDELALRERAEDLLAALQKELAGRVRALRLETPDGAHPCLRVTARSGRAEDIRVKVADGRWWFCGPWAEPIGPADDPLMGAARLLDAFAWADLKALAVRLPGSLRSWPVRTPDGVGLRVDAGGRSGRMWTVVTIADGGYGALIEADTPLEPAGPVADPQAAAQCVARMLGAA